MVEGIDIACYSGVILSFIWVGQKIPIIFLIVIKYVIKILFFPEVNFSDFSLQKSTKIMNHAHKIQWHQPICPEKTTISNLINGFNLIHLFSAHIQMPQNACGLLTIEVYAETVEMRANLINIYCNHNECLCVCSFSPHIMFQIGI